MAITKLQIAHFRNITDATLYPLAQGFNLIYGANGCGKTSILEAIYYLSVGRSFRSSNVHRVIQKLADKFTLFAQACINDRAQVAVGLERTQSNALQIRMDGQSIQTIAELAQHLPMLLINAYCYNLLDAGPAFRRRYLDWGIFYQNNGFLRLWHDYGRALKQRNAALQQHHSSELEIWTQALCARALELNDIRQVYVNQLLPVFFKYLAQLLPQYEVSISYYPGWDAAMHYEKALVAMRNKDMYSGYTQSGPHRAELKIIINGMPAKDILSRGQQKLFVCAMILAQGALLKTSVRKNPIYLVDDLPAELDVASRMRLLTLLQGQESQVFVTTITKDSLTEAIKEAPMRMFHVEHGCLRDSDP